MGIIKALIVSHKANKIQKQEQQKNRIVSVRQELKEKTSLLKERNEYHKAKKDLRKTKNDLFKSNSTVRAALTAFSKVKELQQKNNNKTMISNNNNIYGSNSKTADELLGFKKQVVKDLPKKVLPKKKIIYEY